MASNLIAVGSWCELHEEEKRARADGFEKGKKIQNLKVVREKVYR